MTDTSAPEHVFRLSSIDKLKKAGYLKCCLCFPHASSHSDVEAITERFALAANRIVAHIPILAGQIRSVPSQNGHSDRLEVVVTLNDVVSFQPTVKYLSLDSSLDFSTLEKTGAVPESFMNDLLTPSGNVTNVIARPVLAIQVYFITRGVLVALSLHHSVGDTVSLGTIAGHLSSELPLRNITDDDLGHEALEQSRLRDRLSGSRGIKPDVFRATYSEMRQDISDTSSTVTHLHSVRAAHHILTFSLDLLSEVRDMMNQRFQYIHGEQASNLSCFDALAAILWKGISRALLSRSESEDKIAHVHSTSHLFIPLNVRRTIEPALDDSYIGNATIPVVISSPIVQVAMPFEPGTLARTAQSIRTATQDVSEQLVRSVIAGINETPDPQALLVANPTTDVVITSWTDLGLENAHLGLGLGAPKWVRRVSGDPIAHGCTIYPPRDGGCEVSVQLSKEVMDALLNDENFMTIVAQVI